MAVTIAVLTFAYCLTVTLITRRFADRLRASPRITGALNKVAGTLLIGFGLKLALGR